MKSRLLSAARLSFPLAAAIAALLAGSFTQAANYYWDTNDTATGSGAANGTWGTDMFWSTSSAGTATPTVTTTTSADNLFIAAGTNGTGGVITVDATQSANRIAFEEGAITLSGGTAINLGSSAIDAGLFFTGNVANIISTDIILNSAAKHIAISNGVASSQAINAITGSATSGTQTVGFGSSAAGSINLNGAIGDGAGGGKVAIGVGNTGSGTTTLATANTYSGGTTLWAGTLAVGASGTLGSNINTNNIAINNSGILILAASSNIGGNQSISLDSNAKIAPTAFSSAGTAGPIGRLAVLGLGFNGLPANISQADTDGGIIAINGVTGYDTDLSTLLSGKNLSLGAIGTSTFTGAAGTVVAGDGATYRLGGGGGTITFSTANLFTGSNAVQVGSTLSNGGGTVVFGDAQNYTGATTVSAGTLTLSGANGSATGSSGFTLNGGRLLLDSSAASNTDRIGTVGVTLRNGGELSLNGHADGTTEAVGNLAIGAGPSTVTITATTANSILAGGAFSRSDSGTALFRGTALGQNVTPMGQITLSDASGMSFAGTSTLNNADSTDATKDIKIIPYLVGGTSGTDAGSTFVTYDDTLGFRALNTANQFDTTVTSGSNVRLAAVQTGITTTSINSLIIANSGTSTIADDNILTVASGAVLFNAGGTTANAPSTLGPAGTTGKLNFGSAEGVVTVNSGVFGRISAAIEGSGGLIKAGTGNLTLSGTNTYTGGTVVNGGTLRFGADANLGNAGDTITINGNTVFQPTTNVVVDRPIVLNNGAMLYSGGNVSFTTSGDVSGTGGVGTANISFGSIITLNGTNNTFEGPVVIGLNMTGGNSSIITVKSLADSPTANGRIVFASLVTHNSVGSIFAYTGTSDLVLDYRQIELFAANTNPGHKIQNNSTNNSSMTVNTDLLVTGTGARILQLLGTSTATNTFNGKIGDGTGAPVSLLVNTPGKWTLAGDNSHSGGTTLSGATVGCRLNIASATALGTGTFTISGGNNASFDNTSGSALALTTNNPQSWANDFTFAGSNDLNMGSGAVIMAGNRNVTVTDNKLTVGAIGESTAGRSLQKLGGGTLEIAASSTYTGTTTVTGGTLTLGVDDCLADASNVIINNGTLNLAAGVSDTVGTLNANNAAATINLGAGAALAFADSSAVNWVGALDITGDFVPGSSIRFGTTSGGLTTTQLLDLITVNGGGGPFSLDANGFLITGAPTGYAAWQAANSTTSAIDDDHDHDGVSNGVEYFLGGTTNTTGFTALPGVVNTGGTLSVTWTKAASYTGTYGDHFVVETSATLAADSWIPEASPGNVTISGNNVTYTFPAGTVNFARLKVTGP